MGGDQRLAGALDQHPQTADVRPVHLVPITERHRLRLVVRALAEPDPGPLVREVATVRLGPPQVRLQYRARRREVLPELADDLQRRIGRGVVLHVDGDRRPDLGGDDADPSGVGQRDLAAVRPEREPERGQLHRHLAGVSEATVGQPGQQRRVRAHDRVRLRRVEGVLTEMVDRDVKPRSDQRRGHRESVRRVAAGDIAGHHVPSHRRRGDHPPDRVAPGDPEQRFAQDHGQTALVMPLLSTA